MFTVEELREILKLVEMSGPADNKESASIRHEIQKKIKHLFGCMNAV